MGVMHLQACSDSTLCQYAVCGTLLFSSAETMRSTVTKQNSCVPLFCVKLVTRYILTICWCNLANEALNHIGL